MIKKNVMPKNYEHVKCPYCKSGNTTWKAKESTPYNQKWQCDMCLRTFNYKVPHKGKSMIQVFRDKIMPKKHYIKLIGASAVFVNPAKRNILLKSRTIEGLSDYKESSRMNEMLKDIPTLADIEVDNHCENITERELKKRMGMNGDHYFSVGERKEIWERYRMVV